MRAALTAALESCRPATSSSSSSRCGAASALERNKALLDQASFGVAFRLLETAKPALGGPQGRRSAGLCKGVLWA